MADTYGLPSADDEALKSGDPSIGKQILFGLLSSALGTNISAPRGPSVAERLAVQKYEDEQKTAEAEAKRKADAEAMMGDIAKFDASARIPQAYDVPISEPKEATDYSALSEVPFKKETAPKTVPIARELPVSMAGVDTDLALKKYSDLSPVAEFIKERDLRGTAKRIGDATSGAIAGLGNNADPYTIEALRFAGATGRDAPTTTISGSLSAIGDSRPREFAPLRPGSTNSQAIKFTPEQVRAEALRIYRDSSLADKLPQGQRALPYTLAVRADLDYLTQHPEEVENAPMTYNAAKQSAQFQASKGTTKQLQAISTAYKTLDLAANALDELAQGRTNVSAMNSMLRKFGKGTSDPKTMTSEAFMNLLRSEIPMAVFGGDAGAQADREELAAALGGDAAPEVKAQLLRDVFAKAELNRMKSILSSGGQFSEQVLTGMRENDEEFDKAVSKGLGLKPVFKGRSLGNKGTPKSSVPAKDPLGLF